MKATVITLGALLLVLIGIDLGARYIAAGKVETALAGALGAGVEPSVSVAGFPFLTQAVSGHYREISVTGSGVTLGSVAGVTVTITLSEVSLPLSEALAGNAGALRAARADLRAEIPAAALARATGRPDLRIGPAATGGLLLSLPVQVGADRIEVDAVADADLRGDQLHLVIGDVRSGGTLPPEVAAAVRQDLSLQVDLSSLPASLTLGGVSVTGDSVVVSATADQVGPADLRLPAAS